MCWLWLIGDISPFFRPAGPSRAGMCMLSHRKFTIGLHFASCVGCETDGGATKRAVKTLLLSGLHIPGPYGNSAGQSSKTGKDTTSTRKAVLHSPSDVGNVSSTTLRSAELIQAWTLNSG